MRPIGVRPSMVCGVLIALAPLVSLAACTSDESPGEEEPQLERIDQPAQVDEERLGGTPGAVNEPGSGG
jgi:hypothetical protein